MLKVGITGGMGTGKSTVCKIFNVLGIPTYDADYEAKQLYYTNAQLKQWVKERFGEHLYINDVFQKSKLAEIVFNDAAALQELNQKVHPIVIQEGAKWFSAQTTNYAIKEAALMIESGSYKTLDKLILVQTPLEERIERLIKRDHASEEEIRKRINKQMPEEEKLAYADFTISNGNQDQLIDQVIEIHHKILTLCE